MEQQKLRDVTKSNFILSLSLVVKDQYGESTLDDAAKSDEVQAGRNPKYFRKKSIKIQEEIGKNPTNSGKNPKN